MEREIITYDHSETCDLCNKIIGAGEPVFPLREPMNDEWVLSCCADCIGQMGEQPEE